MLEFVELSDSNPFIIPLDKNGRMKRNQLWDLTIIAQIAAALLVACCFGAVSLDAQEKVDRPVAAEHKRGDLILFDTDINGQSEAYFHRKLETARRSGADLVVIEIRSDGGLLEESLRIAETLRDVKWAHTVAYIPEKALSGAALASLGCDEIIMGENSRIGDAGVIFLDEDFFFKYAPEKLRSDVVRRARDLAESKGRSPDLVEAMIDKDAVVFEQNDKQPPLFRIKYMKDPDEQDVAARREDNAERFEIWVPDPDEWELIEESGPTKFLVVNGERAVQLGLADGRADSRALLRSHLGLQRDFVVHERGWIDAAVYWLNRPGITILLFVVGAVALYFELSAPGISVGGLISGLCFTLFFWSRFLGGTAGWLEVILFLAGVIFILVEVFVIPGFGVSGISGVLLVLVSVVMASQSFVLPSTQSDFQTLLTTLAVIMTSGVIVVISASVMSRHLGRLPIFNRLILSAPALATAQVSTATAKNSKATVESSGRIDVSVGDWGTAESVLRPSGKARFGDKTFDVVANGSFIDPGQQVKVIEVSGNRIVVKQVEE